MKIYLATDHAGFELKEKLVPFLLAMGHEVADKGSFEFDENDDYPDMIAEAAREVSAANSADVRAIILGGSGQGEAIVANKFPNVRAVVFNGQYEPKDGSEVPDEIFLTRSHNDSNILSLGARFISEETAKRAVREWLDTPFSGEERHVRRIKKIEEIEKLSIS
ncbi:MAG: RpiB/LacA/LacB family sugar-phosphate isomerase [Candidatus Paceibacterota bacterium]|jgi:ribose 5-phosphate isomerase B|nr:RpiB/LacA/LacB family sugar-phosphate isomerase [Candidatus Paceibacterota bacterium]